MNKEIIDAAKDLAERYAIPLHHLLAFIAVESAGNAFYLVGKEMKPAIRIEGHYFYKFLEGDKRKEAVQLGLAASGVGAIANPKNQAGRYEQLDRMMQLDHNAALRSISVGLGQVMISWFSRLSFKSPKAMFDHACVSAYNQVEQMVRFIRTDAKLYKAVQVGNWPTVANIYNGPKHKQYDVKMKREADAWRLRLKGHESPLVPDMYMERIKALGHSDVKNFQKQHGLRVDGIIGPITIETLEEVEATIKVNTNAKRNSALKLAGTAIGGSATVAASATQGFDLDQISGYITTVNNMVGIDWRIIAGVVGVVGVMALVKAAYEWWRNRDAPIS